MGINGRYNENGDVVFTVEQVADMLRKCIDFMQGMVADKCIVFDENGKYITNRERLNKIALEHIGRYLECSREDLLDIKYDNFIIE